MNRKRIYVKNFSEISGLQAKEEVTYNELINNSNGNDSYGIEIVSTNSDQVSVFSDLSDDEKYVLDLITLLYENAVRAFEADSVLEEFVSA
jgi:hypothetical protein